MPRSRQALLAVAAFRIIYGAALIVAPGGVTKSWLGPDRERAGAQVAIRALGAREILLHSGAIAAALTDAPVKPWLYASIGGDCSDIVATAVASDGLPDGAAWKTALVAGGSAVLTAGVLAALDR